MKKVFFSLLSLFSLSFSDVILKDSLVAGTKISDFDLKEYKKADRNFYKILSGEVYEKEITFNDQKMKQVVVFKNDFLSYLFLFNKNGNATISETGFNDGKKNKFLRGIVSVNDFTQKYGPEEENFYKGFLFAKDSSISKGEVIKITTKYAEKIENKTAKNELEKYIGKTIMKTCKLKESCSTCDFIEGNNKEIECEEIYIYHEVQ